MSDADVCDALEPVSLEEINYSEYETGFEDGKKQGALEQKEKDKIDFVRHEQKYKGKEQFRVFFKDGTQQVFKIEGCEK